MTNSFSPPDPLFEFISHWDVEWEVQNQKGYSLEAELMTEKKLRELESVEDIERLRSYAQALTKQVFHQTIFISSALERVAALQAKLISIDNAVKQKKKNWWEKIL